MTNPWSAIAALLQQLPIGVRRTLYSIVTAAGAVLAVAQLAGWKSLGPVDMEQALATYALVSSPTGVLALANAKGQDGYAGFDPDFQDRDYDVASFEGADGSDGWDTWEETEVEDVDDEGAFDLSTEPADDAAELTEESTEESTDSAEEPAFS